MPASAKGRSVTLFLLLSFIAGFFLSVVSSHQFFNNSIHHIVFGIRNSIYHHCISLESGARHYFLFPEGGYSIEIFSKPLSLFTVFIAITNAFLNMFFQPMFLCVFTPQVIVNYILFPFFLYGMIRYFAKVPLMVLSFFFLCFYAGLYDSLVEPLLRHGMVCELIYLSIGIAGFTGWITSGSS